MIDTTKDLGYAGINSVKHAYWNLSPAALYEKAVNNGEAVISNEGAIIAHTGKHTGRSAKDKFVVETPISKEKVWWGQINRPISSDIFDRLQQKTSDYLSDKEVYVLDCLCGADPEHQIKVRVVTEYAWHNLFARNMFIRLADDHDKDSFKPDFTVIDAPGVEADPATDKTNSETFVLLNFDKKMVLIGGTSYAGEIKKSIFTVMNYLLPQSNIMPMHSSANTDEHDNTAVFFGLSGTGKTTLSADASRILIGDDEHGWSDHGVFNFEGGCYAKVIRLSAEAEPEIHATTQNFGTVLENVAYDSHSRRIDLDDGSLTENTRSSYPIEQIPNASENGSGSHPKNLIFLTCDAFGVLPPVSRLTTDQAMYHFINGYTAKVAGTEKGVTEPTPNFSPCYGGPFLPLHPQVYAKLLGEKIEKHKVNVWLVNTGWVGGAYGVGSRISIKHTRQIINSILDGSLDQVETDCSNAFELAIPTNCANIPCEVLNPRMQWKNTDEYDAQAKKLAQAFEDNYKLYV